MNEAKMLALAEELHVRMRTTTTGLLHRVIESITPVGGDDEYLDELKGALDKSVYDIAGELFDLSENLEDTKLYNIINVFRDDIFEDIENGY